MNITYAHTHTRLKRVNVRQYNIVGYGLDNLYPQTVKNITEASSMAESVINTRAEFIEGKGFVNEQIYQAIVNNDGQTMDGLLKKWADDSARYDGRAYLCKYNALGTISEIFHIPFEFCRLGDDDEKGKIAVYDSG